MSSKTTFDIETTICLMAKERIQHNGNCCISVRSLGRSVARSVGLTGHNEKPPSHIYCVVDMILKDLGGKLWSTSQEGSHHKKRVYKFEKEVQIHV